MPLDHKNLLVGGYIYSKKKEGGRYLVLTYRLMANTQKRRGSSRYGPWVLYVPKTFSILFGDLVAKGNVHILYFSSRERESLTKRRRRVSTANRLQAFLEEQKNTLEKRWRGEEINDEEKGGQVEINHFSGLESIRCIDRRRKARGHFIFWRRQKPDRIFYTG